MTEHILTFETGDYYGPDLKLEFDCSHSSYVVVKIEGNGSGVLASVDYMLNIDSQVDQIIAELTAWRERERARRGL